MSHSARRAPRQPCKLERPPDLYPVTFSERLQLYGQGIRSELICAI